jgi:transglutaminase-like putative cysteine protease
VAALPLIALAVVPLTLVPATLAYVQGLWLFAMLAALIWGERLRRGARGPAVAACGAAAIAAMVLAPAIDAHKPWFNYETLANGLAPSVEESFDWTQRYGVLNWPRDGREVFEVKARQGDYWKAVNLNTFDGTRWSAAGDSNFGDAPDSVSPAARRRWTQTVTVSIGLMRTSDVVGPGELSAPVHDTVEMNSGATGGRYTSARPMQAGDSYVVTGYSPHPSGSELEAAGTNYPIQIVPQYLGVDLPATRFAPSQVVISVDPFGSTPPILVHANYGPEVTGQQLLAHSPYAQAFALAQRLRARARTPYDYVMSVMRYLGNGFSYDETPPASAYPLATFLFKSHAGYCQQFAGAMALLLRLGGVPARVAAGFTQGRYNTVTKRWLVSDYDAHAWVEAFFPTYGWVRFDPTPAVDPALQRNPPGSPLEPGTNVQTSLFQKAQGGRGLGHQTDATGVSTAHHHHHGGTSPLLLAVLALAGLLVLGLAGAVLRPGGRTPEALIGELERAFARSGRPLEPNVTLSELERRLRGVAGAEAYVQALIRARFGSGGPPPGVAERRAVRAHLRAGLGVTGALRALWALPPRIHVRPVTWLRRNATERGLH